MINHYIDEENHILEITVGGAIRREELKKVFQDVEAPLRSWDPIRVLKRVDSVPTMEVMSWVDDLKFAYNNFSQYKKIDKIAVVTDKDWIASVSNRLDSILAAEIKTFENEDIEEARLWLR